MVEKEVTRSLEQEAIALVNLSNPNKFKQQDVALQLFVETKTPARTDDAVKVEAADDAPDVDMLDGNISMKSLLVTLKKRKLQHPEAHVKDEQPDGSDAGSEADADSAKLPSFRTVFQPPQQQQQQETATNEAETEPVPPELKCKYRTGKCHNMRALKSCGDYHNLCNYHRLRANANQRKLDRKKKEQRLQQQQLTANALASPQQPIPASSHAAAAALASLVAAQPQHHFDVVQQQRPFFAAGVTVPDVAAMSKSNRNRSTGTASCVRPKQEDACSY